MQNPVPRGIVQLQQHAAFRESVGERFQSLANNDGSIRSLGGFSELTNTIRRAREGIDERQFRFGLRVSF